MRPMRTMAANSPREIPRVLIVVQISERKVYAISILKGFRKHGEGRRQPAFGIALLQLEEGHHLAALAAGLRSGEEEGAAGVVVALAHGGGGGHRIVRLVRLAVDDVRATGALQKRAGSEREFASENAKVH